MEPMLKDVREQSETYLPSERWRIIRNVVLMNTAIMFQYTAITGIHHLQSPIHASLGTFALATENGSFIAGSLLLTVIIIRWLGCKWTICGTFLLYIPYISAQYYPRFYTFIPSAIATGLATAPMYCAICTYMTIVAKAYTSILDDCETTVISRFFGIYFMAGQLAVVWGNLISSTVLSHGMPALPTNMAVNSTLIAENCGANFYRAIGASEISVNITLPAQSDINLITTVYLACMAAAFLIITIGVDSLSRYEKHSCELLEKQLGLRLLLVTLRLWKEKNFILILPLLLFVGAQEVFQLAEYNVAFVSCAGSIKDIGYVTICLSIMNGISAVSSGAISKLVGRNTIFIFVVLLQIAVILGLLFWKPYPEQRMMSFVVSGLLGVCAGIWSVQLNVLISQLFPGNVEAAYSNLRLWQAIGAFIAYNYSPYLRIAGKLYILLATLGVGVIGYVMLIKMNATKGHLSPERKDFELVAIDEKTP